MEASTFLCSSIGVRPLNSHRQWAAVEGREGGKEQQQMSP